MRLNARRGSEPYHATNSRIAWSYVRCPLRDVRLLSTADLTCSRSGRASTRFGVFFLRRSERPRGVRKEARRRRVGYQTLINEVLAEHTRKDVA